MEDLYGGKVIEAKVLEDGSVMIKKITKKDSMKKNEFVNTMTHIDGFFSTTMIDATHDEVVIETIYHPNHPVLKLLGPEKFIKENEFSVDAYKDFLCSILNNSDYKTDLFKDIDQSTKDEIVKQLNDPSVTDLSQAEAIIAPILKDDVEC